jgi:hypothetical protein
MTMNNNPFQLRFDIYSASQMRLDQKYNYEFTNYERRLDRGEAVSPPVYPSPEDILTDAAKIYEFVQNKG